MGFSFKQHDDDWKQAISFGHLMKLLVNNKPIEAKQYLDDKLKNKQLFFSLEAMRGTVNVIINIEKEPLDTTMWTPLMFAVSFKHIDLVKYLLNLPTTNKNLCLREPMYVAEEDYFGDTKYTN